ncbi:hypothetical protein M2271_006625 [Streptomyces sp. LBL]|nr:hypothetical protein [Streptomyces sp. LBL]
MLLTPDNELRIVAYTAATGSGTADRLKLLNVIGTQTMTAIARCGRAGHARRAGRGSCRSRSRRPGRLDHDPTQQLVEDQQGPPGLGVIEGRLHGAASGLAHKLLLEVLDQGDAAPVIADELRAGRRIPGLGHRLYPGEDPRARALFELLEDIPRAAPALAAARDVVATAARHTPLHANVDLALAVLTASSGMPATAGETIFAVARTAGWIAHALEEYGERPLRMRPSGHYVGPRPPQPLPEYRSS